MQGAGGGRRAREAVKEGSGRSAPTESTGAPTTDDEIQEKYLERAIRELNHAHASAPGVLSLPQGEPYAGARLRPPAGGRDAAQVRRRRIEEGVAFYGRAGNALMKSFKRLGIDPLSDHRTPAVKRPVADPAMA